MIRARSSRGAAEDLLYPAAVTMLSSTAVAYGAAIQAMWRIPSAADALADGLGANEVAPLALYLLVNVALVGLLGTLVLEVLALLARRGSVLLPAVAGTGLQLVLLLPLLSGNHALLSRHRAGVAAAVTVATFAGLWLALRCLDRLRRCTADRRLRILVVVWAVLVAASADAAFYAGLDRLPLYPMLTLALLFWAQGATRLALAVMIPPVGPGVRRTAVLTGAALVCLALLDVLGSLDIDAVIRIRWLVERHSPAMHNMVELKPSMVREWHKVAGALAPHRVGQVPSVASAPLAAKAPLARKPHVILFVWDAVRRFQIGAYGYPEALTPSFDRLAEGGVLFLNAFSSATSTGDSVPTFLTGLPPCVLTRLERLPLLLPDLLRAYGYDTHLASPHILRYLGGAYPVFRDRTPEELGFTQTLELEWKYGLQFDHDHISALIARLQSATRPRFEYLHIASSHGPFTDLHHYKQAIHLVDAELGRLTQALDALHLWDDTLLVVLSDHGEAVGERGLHCHGVTLYPELTSVPLLVVSKAAQPARIATPVNLIELPYLVMEQLGAAWPIGERPTKSLPSHLGAPLTFQELLIGHRLAWRALRTSSQAFHHRYIEDRRELYDLRRDPGELHDLAAEVPQTVVQFEALEHRLEMWEQQLEVEVGRLP